MPGTIIDIDVNVGDQVTRGQKLLVLEAMKMENEIVAPHDGTVSEVCVQAGALVNAGDTLVILG
jgi:biotin carboxyl carrier protein